MRRRFFIKNLLSASLLSTIPFQLSACSGSKKKVLVLGGTNFVGPYIVKQLLDKNYDVVLFNRGITNPHLFPTVKKIKGDRTKSESLLVLGSETWDAVIDTWQDNPVDFASTLNVLQGKTKHYLYISTIAVYGGTNFRIAGLTEETPLPALKPVDPATAGQLYYPERKLHSENLLKEKFPGINTILRAHTIVGVDSNGRLDNKELGVPYLTYWPARFDKGGDVLAPGKPTDTTQYTDVGDYAKFIVHAIEHQLTGDYNVCQTLTLENYFDTLMKDAKAKSTLTWVPADFIFQKGLYSFSDVPFWVSHEETEKGFFQIDCKKAIQAGLTFSDPSDTFNTIKTAFYKNHRDFDFKDEKNGIKLAREEANLLAEWRASEK